MSGKAPRIAVLALIVAATLGLAIHHWLFTTLIGAGMLGFLWRYLTPPRWLSPLGAKDAYRLNSLTISGLIASLYACAAHILTPPELAPFFVASIPFYVPLIALMVGFIGETLIFLTRVGRGVLIVLKPDAKERRT